MSKLRAAAFTLLLFCASACASSPPSPATSDVRPTVAPGSVAWPLKTSEHIDLWFHAFAMLQSDSARVPYFRRGYNSEMDAVRKRQNVTTKFDDNRQKLSERLAISRTLGNAQFLGMYFANWKEMKEFMEYFILAQGDPRRSSNATMQRAISIIASHFPSAADRDWARLFMQSLEDEYDKFYHSWWQAESQKRQPVVAAIDSLWQNTYYPKFKRYLEGSQQRRGDLILSMPLNGEGRLLPGSATSPGGNYSYMAVTFPDSVSSAIRAIYVFAHEASGRVVNVAIDDHTTPAEARAGVKDRHETDGLVVGGYLLMKRIAPELADGYGRYYLAAAGVPVGSAGVEAAIMSTFPLPQLIRESIIRQIDTVMSGI